jgi:molybdenum cofactor guanylyltransferase
MEAPGSVSSDQKAYDPLSFITGTGPLLPSPIPPRRFNGFPCIAIRGHTGSVYHFLRMSTPAPDLTAFVLAGGKSTRMGMDKAFVTLHGQTLLARAVQLCRAVVSEVRIVGDSTKFAPFAPVIEDLFPGCGPLGGIHAALRASENELNLIVAVDLPFLSPALLQFLIARARDSVAVVTIPRAAGRWQPLCAVYRRSFGDSAEAALRAGLYKIDSLFAMTLTRVIEEEELRAAGFALEVFQNLNTPQELAQAQSGDPHL